MTRARIVLQLLGLGAVLQVARSAIVEEAPERPPLVVEVGGAEGAAREARIDEALLFDLAFKAGGLADPVVQRRLERNMRFAGGGGVEEAVALGMHRTDPVTRARLVSIGRQLVAREVTLPQPSDDVLRDYARAHADRYAMPPSVRLEHVFAGAGEPEALLARLRAGDRSFARAWPLPIEGMVRRERLRSLVGERFAAKVMAAPVGRWTAVRSGRGLHFVRVLERRTGTLPPLDRMRGRVLHDWRRDERRARVEAKIRALRDAYELRLEDA